MNDGLLMLDDGLEPIGVVGSPSSTGRITLELLDAATRRKLVGELVVLPFSQDGMRHYALGQITEVVLRNVWHEDPTIRSLVRQRGRIDAVSERQDTHQGMLEISAVFAADQSGIRPGVLGTVPPTGTPIYAVSDAVLDRLLRHAATELFYLGRVYGSGPKLPLWFKHFGIGPGGAGEAYHIGIFGKTGSGKSVLAKMLLVAYARHREMAILVIDPQGEFSKDLRGQPAPGGFALPLRAVLEQALGRTVVVLSVRDLILDTWELFEELLSTSQLFDKLSFGAAENRQLAAREIVQRLRKHGLALESVHDRPAFDLAWETLSDPNVQRIFYRSESARARLQWMIQRADPGALYSEHWCPLGLLFNERNNPRARTIERTLRGLFRPQDRLIIALNLSGSETGSSSQNPVLWDETIQEIVIRRLLEGIRAAAEQAYQQSENLNTLILIDEAHRLAPAGYLEPNSVRAQIRDLLKDAVRTTRKYGVGWLVISQTLASLHPEIIAQLRIAFFGYGLGLGQEYRALESFAGGDAHALALYRLFRDPHSSFDPASRVYSFMTVGPVSPLSFAGTPLFFNAFTDVAEFLDANGLEIPLQATTA